MPMSPRLLRPRSTVHPEAAAWRKAVVANGGTVSGSTLSAIDKFCKAIDAAGIRDRFYRVNLFAGSFLGAMVPLYRGPSFGGTTYGNATDTNGNFVSGDYTESTGLTGNGSTKYLNTGFKADVLGQTDRHLSLAASTPIWSTTGRQYIGVDNFGCGGNAFWGILGGTPTLTNWIIRAQASAANSTNFSGSGINNIVVSGNGSASTYMNGSLAVTGPSGTFTAPNLDVFVGCLNRCGSPVEYQNARFTTYSMGLSMTASQASSYYSALLAFHQALGRA